jgi:hypothetical protein
MAPSHGLFTALRSCISPGANPASMLFRLTPLINGIRCFNLVVGDVDETADLVLRLASRGKWQHD